MIMIDIDMPDNCDECRFNTEYGFCKAMTDNFCGNTDDRKRPEWCPLKEQEAKQPAIMQDIEGIWSTCSMCGHKLRPIFAMKMDTYFPKFCTECGQAVKWDE